MEDKEYILSDGRTQIVPADQEEAFQAELKEKGLTATLKSNESGNQTSSTEDATVEQNNAASNQETNQSQNNQQQINTESNLEDGSSEQPTYTISGESVTKDKFNELLEDEEFVNKIKDGKADVKVTNDEEISNRLVGLVPEAEEPEVGSVDYFNNQLETAISNLDGTDHEALLNDINTQIEERKKAGFTPTVGSFDGTMEDYKKQFEDIDLEIKTLAETPVEGNESILTQIQEIREGEYTTQDQVDKANKQIETLRKRYEDGGKANLKEVNKSIDDLYKKRNDLFKNYELDKNNYNESAQAEVDAYNLKSEELINTYNTNLDEYKTLSREYYQALDDYEKSLKKYQSGDEAYFLANDVSIEDITLSSYTGKAPLKWKEDEDGNRLYYKPGGSDSAGSKIKPGYYKEVNYDYDRSLGIRFDHDSWGKVLDEIAYGGANVVKALPTLKDAETRQRTLEYMKSRLDNVPENLMVAFYSAAANAADIITADLDGQGYTNPKQVKARQKAEDFMIKMYENLDKMEMDGEGVETPLGTLKRKYTGKGMTGGGTGADIIAGAFGATVSMAETLIPAALTYGASLPIQVAAPMYTEYNRAKAKDLYGDDERFYNDDGSFNEKMAIDELIKNDQTEIAIPLALGVGATALEYIGFKSVMKFMKMKPLKSGTMVKLATTGNREGFTEIGQLGFEKLNASLGAGMSMEDASRVAVSAMTGQEGLEMYLNGFIGGTSISAGGRAINRALRSDNASLKDVNDRIDNLYKLNNLKYNTRNQDVKDAVDLDIKAAEQDLKNYVNENRSIGKILTNEQKESLTSIINEKDNISNKKDKLKTQLDQGSISKKEYGYAIRSLNNQDKRLSTQINGIKNQALEAAAKRTTETVKKQITDMGLKGEVSNMTTSQIKDFMKEEGFDDDAATQSSNEFGLIKQMPDGTFEILLNKDKPMEGTAAHEFMHAVLYKTLGGNSELQTNLGDALEQHVATIKGVDLTNISRRLSQYGEVQTDKDGNVTGFKKDKNFGEETITIMSESILDGSLKFNEGFFTKIGDVIRRFGQNYLGHEIKFNTGRDVFNFIKDYSNSIKTGKVNKAIVKVAREGAKGELVGKAETTKETVTQQSKDSKPNVDNLGSRNNWNNTTWKQEGANKAIRDIKNKGLLDGLIAAKYKVRPVPTNWVNDVLNSPEFTRHVRNFKPEQNNSLFGWINSQLRNKAGSVYNLFKKGEAPIGTKDIDARTTEGAPVVQVEDVSANMETLTDNINYFEKEVQPQNTESVAEQSKLRREIGIGNLGKSEIFKKVKTALATSKAVDEKGFLKSYEKNLGNLLEPTIARILNDPAKLKKYRKGILESVPIKTLVQMQKFLPEKIFIKDHGRQTNLTNLSKFVEKGLLPADILNNTPESKKRRAAGVRVYERLNTTTKQFEDYIDAPVVDPKTGKRSGTRGNNRAKVISEVAKAIGKDATPETLSKDFAETYLDVKDLKGKITPEKLIERISEEIDRKPTLQFSRTKQAESFEQVDKYKDDFIQAEFHGEGIKGRNPLLKDHKLSEYNWKVVGDKDITRIVKGIEQTVLPLLPKECWFGPGDGSVFTHSAGREFGLKSTDRLYKKLKKEILKLKNLPPSSFGKSIPGLSKTDHKTIWSLRNFYSKIRKNPETFKSKIPEIKEFNRKVMAIHRALWTRIDQSINGVKGDKNNATEIMGYLSLVGNDMGHWHKIGAEIIGYSTKINNYVDKNGVNKKARFEMEHAMVSTEAYLYLINASLTEGVGFEATYDLVADNYKLIALDKAMEIKLTKAITPSGKSLQKRMMDDFNLMTDRFHTRYANELVGAIDGGIDFETIKMVSDGRTMGETFNINSDGLNPVIQKSKSEINNAQNAIKAFNKQAELIKKQNKELQADLEKRGYKFSKTGDVQGQTPAQMIKIIEDDLKAKGYTIVDMDNKGMSTFDFDETLIIDGKNFVVATDPKTKEKIKISSGQWPTKGPELAAQGYEFNFDDFVNVRGGVSGPLLQKMKNQIKKYGPENVFILTARPQEAAKAIDGWLKSKGINIPFKNITGLADSRGEAKANWMLEKFAEGYNDMYFVDDALPNVKAVKNVLEQLDIKSKVVQAKIKFSLKAPLDFNIILEQSKGIAAGKRFSVAEARKRGVGKSSFTFFVPPSAEDFKGLVYSFLGKGRQGDAHMRFFKENLLDPFAKASREWNSYKQAMSNDYKALKKQFPKVRKMLNNKVKGTSFTNDAAIRVYLWDKAGFEIPGISKTLQDKLVKQVNSNPELKQFAEGLSVVSRVPQGYIEPNSYWVVESIASDLTNTVSKVGRADFFSEWINNKNVIFSPENLNKIEAIYGTDFRSELEKILYRMETGQNRTTGKDAQVNKFLDWINGSVGAVMFFNMRSSTLQTISMVNFINASDNNVFKAAAAFANQPQFWKDFSYIFNSDMLKQRRAGLQIDVSASELTKAFNDGRSKPQAIIAYLLEKGFTPTQLADSFAIAMGGAPFYRNRVKKYLKDGMNQKQAENQAFLDFQEVAEETQQSSRPDLISNQQAGPLGRLVLAWGNTPMQMTRIQKKKLSDLTNRRRIAGYTQAQSDMANISGIMYYGVIQNLWFGALQTGLMFMLFGWNDDEEKQEKLELRVANGALDTLLRGTGIYGAGISTLKNVLLKWREERKKGWNRDNLNIAQEAINLSPPMGTKMRKIMNAIKTEQYNKGVSKEIGFRIENPNLSIAANWTEALLNIPVARVINKANNLEEAITGNHDIWQRVALVSGWSRWSIGVKDEELEAAKFKVKEKRKQEKKNIKEKEKLEKKEIKKQEKKKIEEEKKKQGIKQVRCSGIKSTGERCSIMVETKAKSAKCMYHKTYTKEEEKKGTDRDNDGIKEFRCTATKSNGQRCKNRTENKSKKCYAHQ